MIVEKPLNNTVQKSTFYVRESDRQLEIIFKSFERLKNLYKTKLNIKIESKLNEISTETYTIEKNNQNYVKLLSQTINEYNLAFKSYEKNFEELGENIK